MSDAPVDVTLLLPGESFEPDRSPWRPIETFDGNDGTQVDLWLRVYPSPRSMGWDDAFRVIDAYRINGKWLHPDSGKWRELYAPYITHWMPIIRPSE